MPRIDPERLLRCLQPLLEPTSGSIKSSEEVDKILGLMSKFSKKLVSKCMYINILKVTDPTALDLFMLKGGWSLIFGWANEGITAKNYALIKEILSLLLITPTTVPRLKENKFPVLIKGLSKDCEDEETRNLAKQVVAKWISVAKNEDNTVRIDQQSAAHQIPVQAESAKIPVQPSTAHDSSGGVPVIGNLIMNPDSLLNNDPSIIPDADNQLMDFDISHNDLPDIDFNLDILSPVVDQQHLDVNMPGVISVVEQTPLQVHPSTNSVDTNVNVAAPITTMAQALPAKEEVLEMVQVQPAPKLFIKTVGGQRTVVQNLSAFTANTPADHFCVVVKDGKNYLMRLKPAEPKTVATIIVQDPPAPAPATASPPKATNSKDSVDGKEKRKLLKKDTIIATLNKVGSQPLKTYSAKSKSPENKDSATGIKKSSNQNITLSEKSENKEKKHKDKSVDSLKKSKPFTSNSKSAAAIAAKQHAEEERLREEIRKQKALMKKRQKEAVKLKQEEKDKETLKKLNLTPPSTTSPSSAMKIPKIPKKTPSFIDAIGIPGSDGTASIDKIKKVVPEKGTTSKIEEPVAPFSPIKKFYGKKEEPEDDTEKPKDRRHKVKVFVSSKSRSDDLLKEMTETSKSKPLKEKEKEKEKEESKPSALGNSIPAVPHPGKISKRSSTESIEKPGDAKKAKLSDLRSDKPTKESKESPPKEKEKKKPAASVAIKESSLFMDMLNASTDTTKPAKRKRRPSTSSDKEKAEVSSPVEKSMKSDIRDDGESPSATQETTLTEEEVKPVFNFYRDTLDDSDEEKKLEAKIMESTSQEIAETNKEQEEESFTPQEGDGKLKSALCWVRPRNKAKKSVRFREDDELREFHYFEMDETERVNVTKQKDFTELTQQEKFIEKTGFMRKVAEAETEKREWRLMKITFTTEILQPTINSDERFIQEEREKNVLGLFLPPGSVLPETPIEPDPIIPVDRVEPKLIPVEDVNSITKVCDYRTHTWPAPKDVLPANPLSFGGLPEMENFQQQQPPVLNPFPSAGPDFNPWNAGLGFSVPPVGVPSIPDMSSFQQFPPPNLCMNMMGAPPIPHANPFAFPPPMLPNGPPPSIPDSFGGNHNRDGRVGNHNRGRFNNDNDQRRNFHGRDRDRGNSRDRDYRDDRGSRDRDRDRDFRRRDRENSDRDYRNHDRDSRNNRDYRQGGRHIRKDIPCRYFKKGFCQNGSRCEFVHDASNSHDDSRSNSHPRQDNYESSKSRRSPDTNRDDFRQSSSFETDSNHTPSWLAEKSPKSPPFDAANATRFALPPSSPTEPEVPGLAPPTESTKVIPV